MNREDDAYLLHNKYKYTYTTVLSNTCAILSISLFEKLKMSLIKIKIVNIGYNDLI